MMQDRFAIIIVTPHALPRADQLSMQFNCHYNAIGKGDVFGSRKIAGQLFRKSGSAASRRIPRPIA